MIDTNLLKINSLGPCKISSPIERAKSFQNQRINFVNDNEKVLFDLKINNVESHNSIKSIPMVELAGARSMIYFDPPKARCAIATCGGICPGVNDVIRSIVMTLSYHYGVKNIYGIRYGYRGFIAKYGHDLLDLNPNLVKDIHKWGGTILGTSRGEQSTSEIVDFLEMMSISILFVIGGDGTLRGALKISDETKKRKLKVSVVGIPKTIDNDIMYIDQSFGFETAFAEAVKSISSAHTESLGASNGIGLVKLMGRHSGFIACFAALAMNDVNFVLIPELPFTLEGENGFLNVLKKRLEKRGHAVIVVAEGAGQELFNKKLSETDASGNIKLNDIGLYLSREINEYFTKINMEVNLKYIDPSYIIRSVPASPQDRVFCLRLGQIAVHAAMCGKTDLIVGSRNGYFVHLPMKVAVSGRKQVDPNGDLWLAVLEATGQPIKFS